MILCHNLFSLWNLSHVKSVVETFKQVDDTVEAILTKDSEDVRPPFMEIHPAPYVFASR